jgi:hypothetical protein
LEANTAKEAVEIIQAFNPRIGGNMFVADARECYGIEGVPDEYYVEKLEKPSVKTNHFLHLKKRNLSFDTNKGFEVWSKRHQERAEELIEEVGSLDDMKALLTDRKHAEKKQAICTTKDEEDCYTFSAVILDTTRRVAHYAQGNPAEVGFEEFEFVSPVTNA